MDVAPDLLGKIFVRKIKDKYLSGKIVEVEAYDGRIDEAAHTYIGKTKRNEVMFERGGLLYVYFTYGMYFCCNVVTGKKDQPTAVLIRAIEPLTEIDEMSMNRFGEIRLDKKSYLNLTSGPGKTCMALSINRDENGTDLSGDDIFILDAEPVAQNHIVSTTRIGIKKSVDLPWRFCIAKNKFVSKK